MSGARTGLVRREDYRRPPCRILSVHLEFSLDPVRTEVTAELQIQMAGDVPPEELVLDGEGLELLDLRIDGEIPPPGRYALRDENLVLHHPPSAFRLTTRVAMHPAANTALSGLYHADGVFLTQCEAEGFRRITYYPDRPDVLAPFTVTLHAPRDTCPVLLANGNLVNRGGEAGGWHWARWEDPFPKPAYLFAMVAGDLACVQDQFRTASGRKISLEIYVAEKDRGACGQAMESLRQAMVWDEQVYGREYDLERYMIVATDSFNMGAMENKGLNIFNSKYVLASPETATDSDYLGIESVIAHEYFHNWTGNRVTLRDWFQLSLKEGLTVFRDQEFSADRNSRSVQRISDVRRLRHAQFAEDASPLAHPVRPDAYKEINNFYTATVYEKGAEVVRMMHAVLGPAGFRSGMDEYFARHDGQAVTLEDFLEALQAGSGRPLDGFLRWYSQAGTPRLSVVSETYDPVHREYRLRLRQQTPPTPGQPEKGPVPIPVRLALFDGSGVPVSFPGGDGGREGLLLLEQEEQEWCFEGVEGPVRLSLLRGFSAPVVLERHDGGRDDRFLALHDDDPFNRWDSFQRVLLHTLLQRLDMPGNPEPADGLHRIVGAVLEAERVDDPSFVAELLLLPSGDYIGQHLDVISVEAVHSVREGLRAELGNRFRDRWQAWYASLARAGYSRDAFAVGERRLRHLCLDYLLASDDHGVAVECALKLYWNADNMTDRLAAFRFLAEDPVWDSEALVADFYRRWQAHSLVVDRWFALQLGKPVPETLQRAEALLRHPDFDWRVPNRVRAVLGAVAANPPVFHARDGSGYTFLARQLDHLDSINPQTAARLAIPFSRWNRYDGARQQQMRAVITGLLQKPSLSRDLAEVLERSLRSA